MLTLQVSSADYVAAIDNTIRAYPDHPLCFVAAQLDDATLLTFGDDQDALHFQTACGVPVTQEANPASAPSLPDAADDDAP